MRYLIFIIVILSFVFGHAFGQFKHKKGKRVPKSNIYKAITAPVAQNTISSHNSDLDGYYPSASNADDKRTLSPRKYRKSLRRAQRKERRLARREERARRKRDKAVAKVQLSNRRNPTRLTNRKSGR